MKRSSKASELHAMDARKRMFDAYSAVMRTMSNERMVYEPLHAKL